MMNETLYWAASVFWVVVGFGFGYLFGRNTRQIESLAEKEKL